MNQAETARVTFLFGAVVIRRWRTTLSWQFADRALPKRWEWEVGLKALDDFSKQQSSQLTRVDGRVGSRTELVSQGQRVRDGPQFSGARRQSNHF